MVEVYLLLCVVLCFVFRFFGLVLIVDDGRTIPTYTVPMYVFELQKLLTLSIDVELLTAASYQHIVTKLLSSPNRETVVSNTAYEIYKL